MKLITSLNKKNFTNILQKINSDNSLKLGLSIFFLYVLVAIFAPIISPYDPYESSWDFASPPSLTHIMGTDTLGRDVFSRVLWGTRVSLIVGLVAAFVSFGVGTILGAIAGYYGGLVDEIISRFIDIYLTLPSILLLIVVVALFGSNIYYTMIFIGLTLWTPNARIIRAQVMSIKELEYVEAIKASGASTFRILFLHILPNSIYPVLTMTSLQMGGAIMTEAGLSFFGLGDLNVVSWGQIIFMNQYQRNAWWLVVFPGLAIVVLVIGANLIGEGINRIFKPKMR
jgi:peptide/nickel transport system permease protein